MECNWSVQLFKQRSLRYFYSSSESSSKEVSSLLSVEAAGSCGGDGGNVGGGDVCGGGAGKVSFNADTGREVGNIDLKSRSDRASLEYFSVFSALVSVIMVEMFCILGSVSVLAIWIVPAVLFKINPSGKDDSFINVPFMRS